MAGSAKSAARPQKCRAGTKAPKKKKSPGPPLRPSQCRAYMRRMLAREFREIVDGFIEGAKTGSCQHVKLATELMNPTQKKRAKAKGTVQQLLEDLEREGY